MGFEEFLQICEVHFPHSEVVKISVAYRMVKHAHRFDVRKDERGPDGQPLRYFEHLRRVALIVMTELGTRDASKVVLALLHDAIEDTRLTTEEIAFVFGPEVSRRVRVMSKVPKAGFEDRLLRLGDPTVWFVKGADRLDNLRSMRTSTPEFRAKQIAETRRMYVPLMDRLVEASGEERDEAVKLRELLLAELRALEAMAA